MADLNVGALKGLNVDSVLNRGRVVARGSTISARGPKISSIVSTVSARGSVVLARGLMVSVGALAAASAFFFFFSSAIAALRWLHVVPAGVDEDAVSLLAGGAAFFFFPSAVAALVFAAFFSSLCFIRSTAFRKLRCPSVSLSSVDTYECCRFCCRPFFVCM